MDARLKIFLGVLAVAGVVVVAVPAIVEGDCGTCGAAPCSTCAVGSAPEKAVEAVETDAEINVHAVEVLRRSGVKLFILDARSGKWDDGRRIPGATSVSPGTKADKVAEVIGKNKDVLVITYCTNVKCPASRMLAKHLKSLGYRNVLEYPGGIEGWAAAGYTVAHVKK